MHSAAPHWSLRLRVPLAFVIALSVVGCSKDDAATAPGGKTSAAADAPAEVRIGYFANLTHAQAVLGVASGEFESAIKPAKLSTRVFNAGPSLIEALFGNEVDIGYVGPGPALS